MATSNSKKQISISSPWGKALGSWDGQLFVPFSDLLKKWWENLTTIEKSGLLPEIPVSPKAPVPDDLLQSFQLINERYFGGKLKPPELRWGRRNSRRRRSITYGYYEIRENRITMNPLLKESFVPPEIFEFVLFHEMLHMVVKGKWMKIGGKRMFVYHTPEFREREKSFEHYRYAKTWFKENIDKNIGFYREAKDASRELS